ncbi:Retron-type reverse transcriptase [Nakamurella panacisegetis]|uniref:RNA-directed DNA polymerase n=1 Tax=Nakamurella panacisegetis TaxID=1090615 RepID=A0A1H0ND79_9ACTN|nr:reverse transcriptase family protein [Nakamurella panacisegetis]SDO90699.1 Retron-type reverse transcriptase [Nakamurella panacisegetis]
MRARDRLAAALADGMLAGDWAGAPMRAQGALVLGERHAWIRRLVREVLEFYPEPPADRPRELARLIGRTRTMEELERRARRRRRRLPIPQHRVTTPTTTVRRPFPVVSINDATALAECLGLSVPDLLWFADTKGLQRRAASVGLHHYRSTWVGTRSGSRLLEAPRPRLKEVQRQILQQLLAPIPVHEAAHGFVAGRSAVTGARPHVDAATVISLDLESFFSSVSGRRIYGLFRMAGFPEPVAHLLTGLCTQATPVDVLRRMPSGHPAAFRLRRKLAEPHLPQGAPTSPHLANLAAFGLDRRLAAYASRIGARYTRYADDLTFSGPDLRRRSRGVVAAVARIVAEEGFALNTTKTRVRGQDDRQTVTGVVVNRHPTVSRAEYDTLRAILHNCVRFGPESQNRLLHTDFRSHLRGRVAWVAALDPERGRRLLATYSQIDFSPSGT